MHMMFPRFPIPPFPPLEIWSRIFQSCVFQSRVFSPPYEKPWRGRNLVIQIMKFFTHSMIKPLPREFQCSTCADSSRAMLLISTSRTSFTSSGLVPKYAGTCITSPFSRSRRNTASARVCTRIDLQQRQQQQQHKKVSYWHNRLKNI